MRRVLVTGAGGFIGRYVLDPLLKAGFEVHAASRLQVADADVHWHQVDLMNAAQVELLMSEVQPTDLLHLAWYTEHGKFWTASENMDWVAASMTLLRQFANIGGRRAVFAGSCAEYDWHSGGHCDELKTACAPHTFYGECKHALERVASGFCTNTGISFAWGRIFFMYGPHETASRFVPQLITGILQNREIPCSEGNQLRDFMYVRDVAGAFARLLESDLRGAINIASGESLTLRQLGAEIMHQMNDDKLIRFGALPNRPEEPEQLTAAVERLQSELGWQASMSLQDGIAECIQWWRQQLASS